MIPFDIEQRRRYPLGYERFRNWLLHRVLLRSMLQADLVIFLSEHARRVIESHASGQAVRSVVIPHGIPSQFRTVSTTEQHAMNPKDSYLLYVSYIDFYKNQLEVVRAFALLKRRRVTPEKLLLVGPENSIYGKLLRAEILRLGLAGDVMVTGAVPYETLPGLYQRATVNIFASESENCPNILLEALATGRPVVCSNRPPMPEFGGDAVLYFDPASPEDLAAKLGALLDDEQSMRALAARASAQSELYDWQRSARLTWDAIAKLGSAHSARLSTSSTMEAP